MGVMDVLKVLEKNKNKQLTSKEIAQFTEISIICVRRILKSIQKDVTIKLGFRDLTFEEKKQKFGYVVNPLVRTYWLKN